MRPRSVPIALWCDPSLRPHTQMNDSRIDRWAFLELVAHAVPSVVRVAAAFQISVSDGPARPTSRPWLQLQRMRRAPRLRQLLLSLMPTRTLQARGPHIPQSDFGGAAAKALEGMDREGISRTIVMPPPFSPDSPGKYDLEDFARAMSERASRLSYLGGRRDPQSDASRGRPLGIHQGRSATELRSPSP